MRAAYATPMPMLVFLLLLAAPAADAQAPDQRRSDQARAYSARKEGRTLPLREIEARVLPMMKGAQYIGVDFDDGSAVYTLKFLRDGTVIWVDVDGRTGQIIGRTGR